MPTPEMFDRCAHTCHECQDQCLKTIIHCLSLGGPHAARDHQVMLADCIAICGVSHDTLHRQSPRHTHTCRACAAICTDCAQVCERLANSDPVMTACAETCRRCATSCNEMTTMKH